MNDLVTQYYHTSTSKHKNNEYLIQLMNKRNRIEFYNLNGNLEDINFL